MCTYMEIHVYSTLAYVRVGREERQPTQKINYEHACICTCIPTTKLTTHLRHKDAQPWELGWWVKESLTASQLSPTHVHTYSASVCADLQEPWDGLLVLGPHGHHILIEPEQRLLVTPCQPNVAQDTEKLKEQPPSPFCMGTMSMCIHVYTLRWLLFKVTKFCKVGILKVLRVLIFR